MSFEMPPKTAEQWKAERERGKWSFVLRFGLKQGVIMFIWMMFWTTVIEVLTGGTADIPDSVAFWFKANLLTWPLLGVLFAFGTWHLAEWNYGRYRAQAGADTSDVHG